MIRIISALAPEIALALERALLRRADLHLVMVTSIDELRTAAEEGAQLCLVGPLFPDGDARDALLTLGASPELARLPVVLVSTREERDELGEAGFAGVIDLPYVGTSFDELLGDLLGAPRRRDLRRPLSVRIYDEAGAPLGRAIDVASGGVALRTRHPLELGRELVFALELPGQPSPLPARGRVLRAEGDRGALALVEPSAALTAALVDLVEPLTHALGLSFRPLAALGPRAAAIGGSLVEGPARAALLAHLGGAPGTGPLRLCVRELEAFDEVALDRWIVLLEELGALGPLELEGVPAWLGGLAARMPAVLARGRATMTTLGVALDCPACAQPYEDEIRLDAGDPTTLLDRVTQLAQRPCAICGGPVELAAPAEATLAFLAP